MDEIEKVKSKAFEIVQNREWENEDDFGDELLDLIRRHKRVKRTIMSLVNREIFRDHISGRVKGRVTHLFLRGIC